MNLEVSAFSLRPKLGVCVLLIVHEEYKPKNALGVSLFIENWLPVVLFLLLVCETFLPRT